jgi:hypothetical protein
MIRGVIAGLEFERKNEKFLLLRKEYANTLKALPQAATYRHFHSMRQQMQWLGHTRLDIACWTATLANGIDIQQGA